MQTKSGKINGGSTCRINGGIEQCCCQNMVENLRYMLLTVNVLTQKSRSTTCMYMYASVLMYAYKYRL